MMKRILFTLCLLLIATPALAMEPIDYNKPLARLGVEMGAGVAAAGNECTGYLVCQNFEATSGECTSCAEDNSETWATQASADTNLDYTTSPIRGSQSANISGAAWVASPSYSEQSTIWEFFKIRFADGRPASDNLFTGIETSAPVTQGSIVLLTTGALQIQHGGAAEDSAVLLADGASANWCIWVRWTKGAGSANGTGAIYADACSNVCSAGTCTRPATAAVTIANGGWDSADANVIRSWFYSANVQAVDQVLIKATEISSVPD